MSWAENSTADELIPKNPCSIKGAGVEKSAERRSQRWIRWLDQFVVFDTDAFVFRGANGALPRRSNWSVLWRRVAIEAGVPGFGSTISATPATPWRRRLARVRRN